jgi:pimeloyl-ACP methyl ester carboxylesterase
VTVASTWPGDVSALVLTGYLNTAAPFLSSPPGGIYADVYPAVDDPKFASSGLDPGYLTTIPGDRGAMFYAAGADPGVIAWDEANKDVVSVNEIAAVGVMTENPAYTSSITAPVLIMVGHEDRLFCVDGTVNCSSWATMNAYEQSYFPSAASLTTESVPLTGHDLALSPTAPVSFALIAAWLAAH